MKLLRVFPKRNNWTPQDELVYIGEPPLFLPEADEIHVSVTFSWDMKEGERLKRSWGRFYPRVQVGGPAYADPGETFTPGRYVKQGIVFTSRGCPNRCPWCFVPAREGDLRELPVIHEGNNIADNNLLACSPAHIEKVFAMLQGQKQVIFSGGLDAKLVNHWHAELLRSISLKRAYFACDYPDAIEHIRRAGEILADIDTDKKRCYVLIGFDNEMITTAKRRLDEVAAAGFVPMAMYYRPMDARRRTDDKIWRQLANEYSPVHSAIRANWHKKGRDHEANRTGQDRRP